MKEKLTPKQFLLIINGPSCAGKSTVSEIILEKYGGIFNADFDKIKWLISDYVANVYRQEVYNINLEVIRSALKNNLSVLKPGALFEPHRIVQIANELGVPVFIANLSAPKDILRTRFLDRISSKEKKGKVANVSEERFWELYDMYNDSKMSTPLEFDSSVQSPEEIASKIVEYIQNNKN